MNPPWPKFINTQTEVNNENCYLEIDSHGGAVAKCRDGAFVIYSLKEHVLFLKKKKSISGTTPYISISHRRMTHSALVQELKKFELPLQKC